MAIPSTDSNKEEHDPVASTSVSLRSISSQQFPMKPVKGDQHDLTNGHLESVAPSVSSAHADDNRASEIAKSVSELGDLAVAINAFKSMFDELQNHLDFIDKAIDMRSKELSLPSSTTQNTPTPTVSSTPLAEGNVQSTEPVIPEPNPSAKDNDLHSDQKLKEKVENDDGGGSHNDVFSLCRTMCSRGLRKYVMSNLSQLEKLREQVPEALKIAPKPSKLVLECIGRFFLQGSRAYMKNSPMIPARQASVLVLEYYLLSGCAGDEKDMYPSSKEEASLAACAWKKRLVVEGGVSKACEIDARGLILFVGCFGIPGGFRHEEIRDLIHLSNPRGIMHALRQSHGLVKKVSDIIDGLMKKGTVVEAVDLAYIFGFEEKLSPQTNLTSYLQKSEDSWKKAKQEARGSVTALKQADEKYLASLRSVLNCLEGHKIDHTKFLPGSKLKEKISNLEKDIDDANKKIQDKVALKRKMDKNDSSKKLKAPELKRSRLNPKDPSIISSPVSFLQEHRVNSNMDGNSLYDASLMTHMLLNSRPSGHLNNYSPASSLQLGSAAGPLADSVYGATLAAGGGKLIGAGIGGTTGLISGYLGDTAVENIDIYRRLGLRESVVSHERSVGQPASARLSSLYRVSPSIETFAGLPDHPSLGSASRIGDGGADLYRFADAIYEADALQASSSAKATNLPHVLPAHGSPYMY